MELKIVVNDGKNGKSYAKTLPDNADFVGKKLKEKIDGNVLGLSGYEFEITGGSDKAGFPMRRDIDGVARRKPLVTSGVGARGLKKGQKARKTVCGNIVVQDTAQLNFKAVKYGKDSLAKLFGKEESLSLEKKPSGKKDDENVAEAKEEKKEHKEEPFKKSLGKNEKPSEKKHDDKKEVKEK
ncbi:MAG TPA: S6e family ribosomal protein [Candidatus Nanoarchaeia archaeon]|nr:S6e family ribosomal protein [Candidatus Nanoarchaeia archaeon]